MRVERIIYTLLIVVSATLAAINWRKAALFQADNESLRTRVEALESETTQTSLAAEQVKASAEKLRAQTGELAKLRNEVTQLRTATKSAESLMAENQKLRAQNQQLQSVAASPNAATQHPADSHESFPRNSWSFAGYGSPEAALVSAIWAMREGDPKTYLDSLAPEEQQRVAQSWQGKSEAEIAQKHKSDVSAVAAMRIVSKDNVGPNEIQMNVQLEGTDRVERVRMTQVGQDWKFGGFMRDQPPVAGAPK